MDEATIRHIQMEGADALLDTGVTIPPDASASSFQEKARRNKADHEAAVSVRANTYSPDLFVYGGHKRADVVVHQRTGDGLYRQSRQEVGPDDSLDCL